MEDDLRSRRVAYVFVVFVHFGFRVISLLIHDVDFGVELFAQSLRAERKEEEEKQQKEEEKDEKEEKVVSVSLCTSCCGSSPVHGPVPAVQPATVRTLSVEAASPLGSALSPPPSLASPSPDPRTLL